MHGHNRTHTHTHTRKGLLLTLKSNVRGSTRNGQLWLALEPQPSLVWHCGGVAQPHPLGIGYLVGYDSSNIYRIWLPDARSRAHQGKVIRTRDVTFRQDLFYQDSDLELQGAELGEIVRVIDLYCRTAIYT